MIRDIKYELKPHLQDGEELIWYGIPKQGIMLTKADIFLIPFSLLWGGFAIFWEYMAISGGAPDFFALFGLPFIIIGLYMIFGRFFYDSYKRKNTVYGLTPTRVIIMVKNKTESINLSALDTISLTEKLDGTGSITLGKNSFAESLNTLPIKNRNQSPTLTGIDDVKKVYSLMLNSQKQ